MTSLADLRAGRCDIALRPTDGLSLTVQLNDSAGDGIDYSAGTWTAYTRLNGRDPANALDLTVDETDANAGTIVLTETAANHTALIGLMSKWSGHWFLVYTESTIPKTFVSGTYLLDTEATNITTGAVTFTVNDAVTVTVTVNTNADATKLPLAGGSMTGPLSIDGWTELTGESPDGWPLIPFPDATNAPPLTFDDDDAGYDFAWYEHRGHLVLAQLDVGDITGNGANYWIPCITLAGPANTGITIPTAIRWNNDPTAQGSTIHPYESGIRTGKGTGMHLEADYTIVVYGNNVEAFRWSPTGLYVASGQELQVGGVDVLLDATDSVDGDNIAAGSVDTAELAADAVTGAKIGDDQIDSEHYVAGSIDNEHLADDAVDSDELAAGAVDPEHLAVRTIDTVSGSTDTAAAADHMHLVKLTNATACTITLPQSIAAGIQIDYLAYGAGTMTFAGDGTSSILNTDKVIDGQYVTVSAISLGSDEWVLVGKFA